MKSHYNNNNEKKNNNKKKNQLLGREPTSLGLTGHYVIHYATDTDENRR